MKKKQTKIINFYGGPGVGKTTAAAYVFSQLKMHNKSVELVTEYAKELTWLKNRNSQQDYEIAIYQLNRIESAMDEHDYVVTDAPILLQLAYVKDLHPGFEQFIADKHKEMDTLDIVIDRTHAYTMESRFHDEKQAKKKDDEIYGLLRKHGNTPIHITPSSTELQNIVSNILTGDYE